MDNRAETADAVGWCDAPFLGWQGVAAQGTVKGFVRAERTVRLLFAAVVLEGTTFGFPRTRVHSLSKVPAGTYTLVVSSVEFKPFRTEVVVLDDRV